MRPRRWVLVVAAIALMLWVALAAGMRMIERRFRLEQLVAERVRPLVGGPLVVGRVKVGFLSVRLQQIYARLPFHAFTIDIQDITVGFSLRRLIMTRGDFSRSMATVVLVNPLLTVRVAADAFPPADTTAGRSPAIVSLAELQLPLDRLRIERGRVHVTGPGGEELLVAEQLSGQIADDPDGIMFELRGRLGSLRRNLYLSARAARGGEPHRLSLRLNGAAVLRPLRLRGGAITAGRLDGICELRFGGSLSKPFDADGWIRVRGATAELSHGGGLLSGMFLALTMRGTIVALDSIGGTWRGVRLRGAGTWDAAGAVPSAISLSFDKIGVGNVLPNLPPLAADNLYGQGRLEALVTREAGGGSLRIALAGGGISLLGAPITKMTAAAVLDSGRLRLDSLDIRTTAAAVRARGMLALADSFPAYRLDYECRIDSLPTLPALRGRMLVEGSAWSDSGLPALDMQVSLRSPSLHGVPLGSQILTVKGGPHELTVITKQGSPRMVRCRGRVTAPYSAQARVQATIEAGRTTLRAALRRLVPFADSIEGDLRLTAHIDGGVRAWRGEATLELGGDGPLSGRILLRTSRSAGEPDRVRWTLQTTELRTPKAGLPLTAAGVLYADSLIIDSASVGGRVSLYGRIGIGPVDNIDLRADYDSLSLALLNQWIWAGALPFDAGTVSGHTHVSGARTAIVTNSELHVRGAAVGELGPLATDMLVGSTAGVVTVQPLVVRKGHYVVMSLDTLMFGERIRVSGRFDSIDIATFLGPTILEDVEVAGAVSGWFASSDSGIGMPIVVRMRSGLMRIAGFAVDSILLEGTLDSRGIVFRRMTAREGRRCRLTASASVPWSFLRDEVAETDTLRLEASVRGDILASIEHNLDSPIGGSGLGTIEAAFVGTAAGWEVERFAATIPAGVLTAAPYIPSGITGFSFSMRSDDSARVHTLIQGHIGRRPVRFRSTHDIPLGYHPFVFGPLDFGIILVETPRQGVVLHMPGFHEKGETVEVEFAPLPPFPAFALSGPLDRLRITGVWVLRNCQFTYPLFESNEVAGDWDPFPYVTWEMDVAVGNRNVVYYRDISGRRRKGIRFVEAWLDPTSRLKLRGREMDNSLRLLGQIRSYKGSVYFGRVFDRRFEVGLDFSPQPLPRGGYDNMPIMWGSAETFSDTSRQQRIKLTLQTIDPLTGGISERGRVAMLPRPSESRKGSGLTGDGDSIVNFNFHLSSDFEEIAGAAEREFFKEAGLRFSTFEGAGELVSDLGEQYLHRYLLQRLEKRLARRLGLDVITFETSIASNYFTTFYNREFAGVTDQWTLLALSHVGVTIGRYFFRDNIFFKARGELVPIEEVLVPEYSLGVEFQPVQYLFMDFSYGVRVGETTIEHDPRFNLQLRLPLTRVRKSLRF